MGMALNLAKKRKKLKGNFLRLDEIALRLGQLCLNCYEVSLCQVSMAIANFYVKALFLCPPSLKALLKTVRFS